MGTRPHRFGSLAVVFLSMALPVTLPPLAAAQPQALSNDAVLQMIRWKMTDAEIIAVIERNDTQFDLTPSTVALLKGDGVDDAVLEAMWKATVRSSKTAQPAPAPAAAKAALPNPSHSPTTTAPPLASQASVPASSSTGTNSPSGSQIPSDNAKRLAAAKAVKAETIPASPPSCPLSNGGKKPRHLIQVDWDSGSISPSRVDSSGPACFEVHNFNDILYLPVFSLTEIPPTGSDIDLLNTAMGKLTSLTPATAKQRALLSAPCSALSSDSDGARKAAATFQDAVKLLEPGKDSNGKVNYVPLATTLAIWQAQEVPREYNDFQGAVANVIKELNLPQGEVCSDTDVLARAETVVLDSYVPARTSYVSASRPASQHIVRYTGDLEATSAYDFAVKPTYGGADTNAGSKTFHLSVGRKILTASAGFLITELPARSYSSRTVPTGMTNSATQNVLGVDFGNGPRPALTALLNYHLFFADWRRFGLALSAGPVFDISSGKADTSRLGFFGGLSLHLWNRLYVTPGVHVGEFADFPQGFTAGSIIPPNTGTPQPSKRYTARFAIGITFKVKDLGEPSAKSSGSSSSGSSVSGGPSPGGRVSSHGTEKPK